MTRSGTLALHAELILTALDDVDNYFLEVHSPRKPVPYHPHRREQIVRRANNAIAWLRGAHAPIMFQTCVDAINTACGWDFSARDLVNVLIKHGKD